MKNVIACNDKHEKQCLNTGDVCLIKTLITVYHALSDRLYLKLEYCLNQ